MHGLRTFDFSISNFHFKFTVLGEFSNQVEQLQRLERRTKDVFKKVMMIVILYMICDKYHEPFLVYVFYTL